MPGTKESTEREQASSNQAAGSKLSFLLVAMAFFFGVKFFLPITSTEETVHPDQVRTGLAILVLAGFLWLSEAIPLAITALLVPVLAVLTGVLEVPEAFRNFAHPLMFLFLGGFGMAAALSRQKIDRWLAQRIVHLARGHFRITALALSLTAAALSMWISNTATIALLLPVTLGILGEVRTRTNAATAAKAAPLLLLGIAYSASVGGMGTLIGTAPNLIAAEYLQVNFSGWLTLGLPCVAVLLPTALILLHLVLRPGPIPSLDSTPEPFSWTPPRIATLTIFALTILAWLNSRTLANLLGISKNFDSIIAMIALILLSALKLVQWSDVDRTTDWGVVLLFGGGLTLSEILKPDRTGASSFLADQLHQLSAQWPTLLLIGAVVFFVIFLTELSSNTATTALLVPIFGTVAIEMGFPPSQLILPLTFASSCAFMLPIATPPNAIVFGSGQVPQRTMMRVGLVLNITLGLLLAGLSRILF